MKLEQLIERHTIQETAKILNSSYATISRRLKQKEISRRELNKAIKINQVLELLKQGYSVLQISRELNKHRSSIYYYKNLIDKA